MVELHVVQQLFQLALRQAQFGRVVPRIAVEYFEVAGGAASVTQIGEPAGICGGLGQQVEAANFIKDQLAKTFTNLPQNRSVVVFVGVTGG